MSAIPERTFISLGNQISIPSAPYPLDPQYYKQMSHDITITDQTDAHNDGDGYRLILSSDCCDRCISFPCSFSEAFGAYITCVTVRAGCTTIITRRFIAGRWMIWSDSLTMQAVEEKITKAMTPWYSRLWQWIKRLFT